MLSTLESTSTRTAAPTRLVWVRFDPGVGNDGKWIPSDQARSIPTGLRIPAQGFRTLGKRFNPFLVTRVRGRRSSRLPLPVVAMGSVPHIYRREGHSPGDPKDVAPFRGTT